MERRTVGTQRKAVQRNSVDARIVDLTEGFSVNSIGLRFRVRVDCCIVGLSAEHATVSVGTGKNLEIGDRVSVTPGYSDFTFVLHDRVIGHRADRVETVWELLGRGMLQ